MTDFEYQRLQPYWMLGTGLVQIWYKRDGREESIEVSSAPQHRDRGGDWPFLSLMGQVVRNALGLRISQVNFVNDSFVRMYDDFMTTLVGHLSQGWGTWFGGQTPLYRGETRDEYLAADLADRMVMEGYTPAMIGEVERFLVDGPAEAENLIRDGRRSGAGPGSTYTRSTSSYLTPAVCDSCQCQLIDEDGHVIGRSVGTPNRIFSLCFDCADRVEDGRIVDCSRCEEFGDPFDMDEWFPEDISENIQQFLSFDERTGAARLCLRCSGILTECEMCDRMWAAQWVTGCSCSVLTIHNYGFKPAPNFHPSIPTGVRELYIGVEIEMEYGRSSNPSLALLKALDGWWEDLFYAKSDSSISRGVEVVTHPFSPKWASVNFPYDQFQELLDAGFPANPRSCGQHIHVSKDAFDSAHLWKFIQLHYAIPEFCGIIGGRGTDSSWSTFAKPESRVIKTVAQTKNSVSSDRGVAVNLNPRDTVELRYPTGTIVPDKLRKNQQWVQAIYDYTDILTVEMVRLGVLKTPGPLVDFIYDRSELYPQLATFIEQQFPKPISLDEFVSSKENN